MVRSHNRVRAGTDDQAKSEQKHREATPAAAACGKIIVRLRPVLPQEVADGETQSASATTRGGEVKVKLLRTKNYRSAHTQHRHEREEQPAVLQVDSVCGPDCSTSEVYATAASRLVDRAVTGGGALLLVAGTPGSGRSHTLWGSLPRQQGPVPPSAVAEAPVGEPGVVPLALADLARRWRCGNSSPFWSSRAVTGTSSSASSSCPFSPPLAFWVCAAEVLPGGLSKGSDGGLETTTVAEATTRDLLRSPPSSWNPGGDGRVRKPAQSPRSPSRWATSARDLLTGLTSSPSPPRPLRFSVGSGGGGFARRNSAGGGRAGKGAVAAADGVLLASRVLAGVTEVHAEGVEAALALFRRGLRNRRKEGHVVISARLVSVGGSDKRVDKKRVPDSASETGELVFVELGDCPNGDLPQTLRTALAHLKVGNHGLGRVDPRAPRSSRLATTKKAAGVSPPLSEQSSGNNVRGGGGGLRHDPLWALLSAFAQAGTGGADTLLSCPTTVTGEGGGGADLRPSTSHSPRREVAVTGTMRGPRTGEGGAARGASVGRGPLVVSVIATLRSGDGRFQEEKALLQVLAKPCRNGTVSWRRRPLSRIMVSMPSFSWRSSPTGPAGTAAAAAAAVAVAYGSTAASAAAVPSAPPASSSEEASVARSNSAFSRSASCSLSSSEAAATAATATAAASDAGGDVIVSSGAADGGFGPPTFPSSRVASLTAEEDVVCGVGTNSTPFGNGSGSTARAVGGNLALQNLGELATGGGHDSARTGGQRSGSASRYRFSIEEADEEAAKAGGTMKASWENKSSERRMSPPWDDSMLGLRGLTPDELVARVLQAEKESRHWQAQHALVDRKLTDLLTAMTKHSRRPGGDGGRNVYSGGSLHGETARVPPEADAATTGQGSSAPAAGSCPEQPSCFSPHRGGRATETTEATPRVVTPADEGDAGTSVGIDSARNRGCGGVDEARDKTARGMIDEWNGNGMPISPRITTIEGARGKEPMLHSRGDGGVHIAVVDQASTNKRSLRSTPVGVAAADNGDSNSDKNDINDSGNNSPSQQLTFKERRAVFSSNSSVPAPPGGVALPWSIAVGKVDTRTTPSPPQPSLQRAGSCTPPTIAAFSPAAVEAARQNLKRSKTSANRVSAPVALAATGASPRRGRGRPCRSSGSRSSAASVSPVLLSSSAASSPSTAPFTPPRSRHRRGTAATAPSPPAPSPCSTADRFRGTPGSPARLSSASSTSSWVPSPQSSSAPFSPQLESPPSFPKPIAEMGRRARAVAPDGDGKLDDEEFGDSEVLLSVRSGFWQGWPGGRCQGATGTPRESSVSVLPSKVDLPGGGRPGVRSGVGIGSGTDQPRHQQQQQQQQQRGRGTARPATIGDGAGGDVSFSPGAGAISSLSGSSRCWSPAVKYSPSGPPSLSPAHAKAVSASSSSMASVILETAGAAPAAPASRLPPTAPTLSSRAPASHPEALQPTPAVTENSGSAAASSPFWNGTALRQKSVRLQQPSVSDYHVPAAAVSGPNLVPEDDRIEGASIAAGARGVEGRDGVKVCYSGFGGGGGGGGGTSTRQELPDSKRSLASPQDDVAASFRGGGGGGGGGGVEDAWKERPPGVGPWPLFEQTREGRASLDDKLRVSNRGSVGSSGGTRKIESSTAPETNGEPTATAVIPSVAAEADPEVSIGNISTMQASRLRALREKMERRYSWARGTTIPATKGATTSLAVNIAASSPIPGGSHSSLHMSGAYSSQSQEGMVEKPWGSRTGITAPRTAMSRTGVDETHAHNNGGGPPPNRSSEGFKLMVPAGWDPPK